MCHENAITHAEYQAENFNGLLNVKKDTNLEENLKKFFFIDDPKMFVIQYFCKRNAMRNKLVKKSYYQENRCI